MTFAKDRVVISYDGGMVAAIVAQGIKETEQQSAVDRGWVSGSGGSSGDVMGVVGVVRLSNSRDNLPKTLRMRQLDMNFP